MIRPLRARHRAVVSLLAVLVPLGVAAALASRTTIPSGMIPADVSSDPAPLGERPFVTWYRAGLWAGLPIYSAITESADGYRQLVLHPVEDLKRPDVLVYWAPLPAERGALLGEQSLPDDAVLLGSLAGTQRRAFNLPRTPEGEWGRVLLYSLAHDTLVGQALLGDD